MDDDDFEEFDLADLLGQQSQPLPSRRFRKADLFVLPLHLLYGVASAVTATLELAHDLAGMNSNWAVDREVFHEQAALEIETLTGENDG